MRYQPIQTPFVYFISANKNTFGIKVHIFYRYYIYIFYRYLTLLFAAKKGCFGDQLRLILKALNIVFYSKKTNLVVKTTFSKNHFDFFWCIIIRPSTVNPLPKRPKNRTKVKYYNRVVKEKWPPSSVLRPGPSRSLWTDVERCVRGTAGGDRLFIFLPSFHRNCLSHCPQLCPQLGGVR